MIPKLFLPAICMCFLLACDSSSSDSSSTAQEGLISERLDLASFKEKLATTTNGLLIDLRTPEECAEGKIEGAVEIDYYQENFTTKLNALDKEQTTFIYCRSGGRSGKTLRKMKELGFKEVYELKTGYNSWQ